MNINKPISFKGCHVVLSKKNNGNYTKKNVVDTFNSSFSPQENDISNSVNFFIPAAGEGSRFKIAKTIGDYNKTNLPINIGKGEFIHPLDFVMALSKTFSEKSGIQTIMEDTPKGSFSGIVNYYMSNPIKDTVICSADSMFDENIDDFILSSLESAFTKIAILGGISSPNEVENRYGILDINPQNMSIKGFIEKPKAEIAKKYTKDGINIVNTGCYYLSKDVIEKLIEELKSGKNNIKKNDKELYDYALAIKYVHQNLEKWFNTSAEKSTKVQITDSWIDTGEPTGFYNFAKMVKKGNFLKGFSEEKALLIKRAFERIFHFEEKIPYANFSNSDNLTKEDIAKAPHIEGVRIIA